MALVTYTDTFTPIDDIQTALEVFWAAQPIRPAISYDNVDLDAAGVNLTFASDDPDVQGEGYVFFQAVHATGNIAALGTKRFRQIGVISASIYVESGVGRKRSAGKIADQMLKFFQKTLISGITFQFPRINEVGYSGRWWQVNVISDFLYDINRSS